MVNIQIYGIVQGSSCWEWYSTEVYGIVHCRTELYGVVQSRTELYGVVVVQCRTELYGVVQCYTELYRNIRNSTL